MSSSELLSDISDTNVITFDDQHDTSPDDSMELHNVYVAAGILASALIALAFLVSTFNKNFQPEIEFILWKHLI